MASFRHATTITLAAGICLSPGSLLAQDDAGANLAQANNPLAAFNTLNFQNQYNGSLTGLDDTTSNSFFLRGALPVSAFGGDWLVRATLPVNKIPVPGESVTGIGDFNVFAAYLIDTGNPTLSFGIGPQITAPTAAEDETGSGKWSAGLANVLFNFKNPNFQWGYLLTWQASFAGDEDRADVNNAAFQPLVIAQLGKGWYARSTAIWTYDFETDNYNVPLGLGLGKVIKTDRAIVNVFVEPQYSVASSGDGLPEWGVFAGVNFQFPK
ncbi:hypothetical protein [Aliiruegeria sabulilitoris]|uniref:hypothetical protein n=1 Tax=Aliiruegeria sabulilitoris TaxID=1510458 RepID=UPI00082AF2AD|nr:hypothetical protein [Aliiruegeria sabulilitoris]NDR58746.1 hypothetical protein [Pseudoruegeria sp. M32A2M]